MKKQFLNILMLCFFTTAVIFNGGCSKEEDDKVIAVINGKEINVNLLEDYFFENLNGNPQESSSKNRNQSGEGINKVKSCLFEDFIDVQLILEQAKKAGITIGKEEMIEFLSEIGEATEDISEMDSKKVGRVTQLLTIQKFKNEKLYANISVSEEELKQYFQEQMKEKGDNRRFMLGIIVVDTEQGAREILKNIKDKKVNFYTLAETYAMIPGKVGPQAYFLAELPENIREEVKQLEKGQISKVMPLLGRFCLIRMEGKEKAGVKPFNRISEDLKEKIIREKEEVIFENYIENLRKNAEIEIFYNRLPFTYIKDQ